MIVICLTDCPPKVRGDLTKWLVEVNTGVYVGNLSARVRDNLWDRVCKNLKDGRATMVYSSSGEQKLSFRVHNTPWEPVDIEGITLMRRPLPGKVPEDGLPKNYSHAAKRQLARKSAGKEPSGGETYCAIDLETTGLDPASDEILEFGAVIIENSEITKKFSRLVQSETPIPAQIAALTGITQAERDESGIPLADAMKEFVRFIGRRKLVIHNAAFDMSFLQAAGIKCQVPMGKNPVVDTLVLSRRKLRNVGNYKLSSIAAHLEITQVQTHRALDDSCLTAYVYEKLKGR